MVTYKEVRLGVTTGLFVLLIQGLLMNTAHAETTPAAKPAASGLVLGAQPSLLDQVELLNYSKRCSDNSDSKYCKDKLDEFKARDCTNSSDYKDASDSMTKAKKYCAESGMANTPTCIAKAKTCASKEYDTFAEYQRKLREEGEDDFDSEEEYKERCTHYGRKAYDEQLKDQKASLKDSEKSIAEARKKMVTAQEDYQKEQKKIAEDDAKLQEEFRKLTDTQASESAKQSQDTLRAISDFDRQKQEISQRIHQTNITIAKTVGERAVALAQLSDATIQTNCNRELEILIAQWRANRTSYTGLAGLTTTNAEKRRIMDDTKTRCYETAEATRRATRKQYKAQLDSLRADIQSNEDNISSVDQQKSQMQSSTAALSDRLKASLGQAYNQLMVRRQKLDQDRKTAETIGARKFADAQDEIKKAEAIIAETTYDTKMLGARPRGEKTLVDAKDELANAEGRIEVLEANPQCKAAADSLRKTWNSLSAPPKTSQSNNGRAKGREAASSTIPANATGKE